jgi:hypothetical protein
LQSVSDLFVKLRGQTLKRNVEMLRLCIDKCILLMNETNVVDLENVPQSSVGAPLPLVLSDEHKILLAYIVQNTPPDWDGLICSRG